MNFFPPFQVDHNFQVRINLNGDKNCKKGNLKTYHIHYSISRRDTENEKSHSENEYLSMYISKTLLKK